MFIWIIFVLLDFFGVTGRVVHQRAILIPIGDGSLIMKTRLGNFNTRFQLDTNVAEILVVDAECGRHFTNCPRYCNEVTFALIFCPMECQHFTPQTLANICSERERFNATHSDTTKQVAGNWKRQFPGTRQLSGRLFSDFFRYDISTRRGRYQYTWYFWLEVQFVSALFFDQRLFTWTAAIFGLGPGPASTIEAFFRSEAMRDRKTSIAFSEKPWSIRLQTPAIHTFMLTVGGFDGYRCAEWELIPSVSPSGWVVETTEMELLGRVFPQNFTVCRKLPKIAQIKFDFKTELMQIPLEVADELLAAEQIVYFRTVGTQTHYATSGECRDDWVRLRFGEFWLELKFAKAQREDPPMCAIELGIDYNDPHLQRPVITLGTTLFNDWCLGFDYERMAVGIGRRRKRPAYPLLPEKIKN